MKLFATLVFFGFLLGMTAVAGSAGETARFSQTFPVAEFADSGLEKLTSDQLAILDALVRRDDAMSARTNPAHPRAALFSQRLSADERTNIGFSLLTLAEIAHIDAQVSRLESINSQTSPSSAISGGSTAVTETRAYKTAREIHGLISLLYGTGGHGFRAQGASIDLVYHDPDHNYTITAGYSELRTKGLFVRRDCPGALVNPPASFSR